MNESPYSWGEAREAINTAKAAQKIAEDNVRDAYKRFGMARRAYQMALAKKILELRAGGAPATVCPDLARGDAEVARLRFEKDVAEGVKDAAGSALWRHSADRRELEQLVDWSKRRELAEGAGEPQWSAT